MNIESIEIRNCQRCGGKPIIIVKTLVAHIECRDCGHHVIGNTLQEAADKWNSEPKDGECESCKIGNENEGDENDA